MRAILSKIVLLAILIGSFQVSSSYGQIFLFVEQMTEIRPIKILEGSTISIKTKDNQEWHNVKMDRLIESEGIIVHEDGYVQLSQITHLRRERLWIKYLAFGLKNFAYGWGVYGSIAWAAGLGTTSLGMVAAGVALPWAIGWVLKKLWLWKKYKIGKKVRLRIIDLSLPDDPYGKSSGQIRP